MESQKANQQLQIKNEKRVEHLDKIQKKNKCLLIVYYLSVKQNKCFSISLKFNRGEPKVFTEVVL